MLWATCRLGDLLSDAGLVVRVDKADRPKGRFWLVLRPPRGELCPAYLAWDEDLVIRTDGDTLAHWHLRHLTYDESVATGRLEIVASALWWGSGPTSVR